MTRLGVASLIAVVFTFISAAGVRAGSWQQLHTGLAVVAAQVPGEQSPLPGPPASPSRFSLDVKAMDEESAGPGVTVKRWMEGVDTEWERVWGWKPSKPTTIYLYFDGYRMADGLAAVAGSPLANSEREYVARYVHGLATKDNSTGGWAVLLNLRPHHGESLWEPANRSVLIHEYAHVMQLDVAGFAGPVWFKEGMAQLAAFVSVPQAMDGTDRLAVTSGLSCQGQLPSLRSLNDAWGMMVSYEPQLAYGMSYFAVKHLADRVGGQPLLRVLASTAAGEEFEVALERITGFTLERLDEGYRNEPCHAYR